MPQVTIDIELIREAQRTLAGVVHRTPMLHSTLLGEQLGVELYLKAELFQKTGSFKPRGALNRLRNMDSESLEKGLITVSAGNHAQGLAWASAQVGAPCTVVMPDGAPQAKVDAARSYGAEVLIGGPISEIFDFMFALQKERRLTFVHPFDDPHVIAGQGTVGLEIVEDVPTVDLVVVPVGGGGLISGISTAVKALRPQARMVGVEPQGASALTAARAAGEVVTLSEISTIADGLAAPMVGTNTLEITTRLLDDLVIVSDDEIVEGMEALATRTKLYAEGGGAAATAGLLTGKVSVHPGETVVSLVSGGNIDFEKVATLRC